MVDERPEQDASDPNDEDEPTHVGGVAPAGWHLGCGGGPGVIESLAVSNVVGGGERGGLRSP